MAGIFRAAAWKLDVGVWQVRMLVAQILGGV
jgi:hypothetical protein